MLTEDFDVGNSTACRVHVEASVVRLDLLKLLFMCHGQHSSFKSLRDLRKIFDTIPCVFTCIGKSI